MSFLRFTPTVFVIGDEYEILLYANSKGLFSLKVGKEDFYERNSGVLSTEKCYARIRIKQHILDRKKEYTVVFRESIKRREFFPKLYKEETETFVFKALEKEDDIHIYQISEINDKYDIALKTATRFAKEIDLYIINGDLGSMNSENDILEKIKFVGELSGGRIPVIFTRGEKEARGRFAEYYTDYFPNNEKKTYYAFSLGVLNGVVLDCGEDREDSFTDYKLMKKVHANTPEVFNKTVNFHEYRKREVEFLQRVDFGDNNKITFAISHICPAMPTEKKDSDYDIERVTYFNFNKELERLKVKFMLSSHLRKNYVIMPGDERSILTHNYPIVFSAGNKVKKLYGVEIVIKGNCIQVRYNDDCRVTDSYETKLT